MPRRGRCRLDFAIQASAPDPNLAWAYEINHQNFLHNCHCSPYFHHFILSFFFFFCRRAQHTLSRNICWVLLLIETLGFWSSLLRSSIFQILLFSDLISASTCLLFTELASPPSKTPRRRANTVTFVRYILFSTSIHLSLFLPYSQHHRFHLCSHQVRFAFIYCDMRSLMCWIPRLDPITCFVCRSSILGRSSHSYLYVLCFCEFHDLTEL